MWLVISDQSPLQRVKPDHTMLGGSMNNPILTQHAAVVFATKSILGDAFKPGVDVKTYVTKEQKAAITSAVTEMLATGEADLSIEARAKFDTEKKLYAYTAGMVTNWFNKSKDLNGDVKYVTKNPGSRIGAGNDQLSALKALRSNLVAKNASPESVAKIDAAINGILGELKAKTGVKDVDMSLIPEELRDLV